MKRRLRVDAAHFDLLSEVARDQWSARRVGAPKGEGLWLVTFGKKARSFDRSETRPLPRSPSHTAHVGYVEVDRYSCVIAEHVGTALPVAALPKPIDPWVARSIGAALRAHRVPTDRLAPHLVFWRPDRGVTVALAGTALVDGALGPVLGDGDDGAPPGPPTASGVRALLSAEHTTSLAARVGWFFDALDTTEAPWLEGLLLAYEASGGGEDLRRWLADTSRPAPRSERLAKLVAAIVDVGRRVTGKRPPPEEPERLVAFYTDTEEAWSLMSRSAGARASAPMAPALLPLRDVVLAGIRDVVEACGASAPDVLARAIAEGPAKGPRRPRAPAPQEPSPPRPTPLVLRSWPTTTPAEQCWASMMLVIHEHLTWESELVANPHDWSAERAALVALGAPAVDVALRYLDDPHFWVRCEALHVLEALGPIAAAAVPALAARKASATGLEREYVDRALSATQKER